MAESEPGGGVGTKPDNPVNLRFTLITMGVLVVALLVMGAVMELSKGEDVVLDGPLALPPLPASRMGSADEGVQAQAVVVTPELEIEGPTTLLIEMSRERVEGWVEARCLLIHLETGEVQELWLTTDLSRSTDGELRGEATAKALLDQVPSGRYLVRLEPAWEPKGDPTPGWFLGDPRGHDWPEAPPTAATAPDASLRITAGVRTPFGFLLALALLLLPGVFSLLRWWRFERAREPRAVAERPDPPGVEATS